MHSTSTQKGIDYQAKSYHRGGNGRKNCSFIIWYARAWGVPLYKYLLYHVCSLRQGQKPFALAPVTRKERWEESQWEETCRQWEEKDFRWDVENRAWEEKHRAWDVKNHIRESHTQTFPNALLQASHWLHKVNCPILLLRRKRLNKPILTKIKSRKSPFIPSKRETSRGEMREASFFLLKSLER